MYHSNTKALLNYWRDLRGEAFAPARADIDPGLIREVLTQVFMLGRGAPGEYQFRLAGQVLCDAHKLSLRGHAFLSLWAEDDRLQLKLAMESMMRGGEPLVINAAADAGPYASSIELLLAPLRSANGEIDRVFGFFQPLLPLSVLHDRPIDQLCVSRILKAFDHAEEPPKLRLAAVAGRIVG
ncbi:MAG: hypothetical protein JWO33_2201 [Caulobacteraceae bacterium]|nr:hypothetical protein [Caulobacteraceae bacterium]